MRFALGRVEVERPSCCQDERIIGVYTGCQVLLTRTTRNNSRSERCSDGRPLNHRIGLKKTGVSKTQMVIRRE